MRRRHFQQVDQSWAAEELLLVIIQAGLKNFAVSFARENRNAQGCTVISARLLQGTLGGSVNAKNQSRETEAFGYSPKESRRSPRNFSRGAERFSQDSYPGTGKAVRVGTGGQEG